jgi:D-amino peptidase
MPVMPSLGSLATALCTAFLLQPALPAATAEPVKLKVLISVDMEGIVGVVTGDQAGPEGFEYERFREFMTAEALAAVEGARAAGATEILVVDAHGNGESLLIEKFPHDVRLIRSWPRPLGMVEGVDETVDAVVFIGYHAGASNPRGVLAHTISGRSLTRLALNGKPQSEGSWNAAIAGHFGVPVVMVSGDDAVSAEVRGQIRDIEAVEVKRAISTRAANSPTPQAAAALIRERTQRALEQRAKYVPLRLRAPVTVKVSFTNRRHAELLAMLPMFERSDAHSVRLRARDMLEASRVVEFIGEYDQDFGG